MINKNTILERSTDILHTKLDNEVVMMSIETGEYHGANPVGNRIWELMENPVTMETLCDELVTEYNVEASVCEQETLSFLNLLLEKKLIITKS